MLPWRRNALACAFGIALLASFAGPSRGSGHDHHDHHHDHDHHDHGGHDHGGADEEEAACTASTLAPFECMYESAGGDVRVHWTYIEERPWAAGEVWLALETGAMGDAGWLGLSFQRDAGTMVPADAVIARFESGGSTPPDVAPYRISGYDVEDVVRDDLRQSLDGTALDRDADGRTILRFNRTLDNGGEFPIDPNAFTSMGWAVDPGASSSRLGYHSQRGGFTVAFASGRAASAKHPKQGRYLIHGYLNIAAWSFLVLSGILTFGMYKAGGDRLAEMSAASGSPVDKEAWALRAFRAHFSFVALGLIATASGVLYIFFAVGHAHHNDLKTSHGVVGVLHRKLGLAVLVLPIVNAFGGVLRPPKTHSLYGVFRLAHVGMGLLAFCLAVTNVGLGVERYEHLVGASGSRAFFEHCGGLATVFALGCVAAAIVSVHLTASALRGARKEQVNEKAADKPIAAMTNGWCGCVGGDVELPKGKAVAM